MWPIATWVRRLVHLSADGDAPGVQGTWQVIPAGNRRRLTAARSTSASSTRSRGAWIVVWTGVSLTHAMLPQRRAGSDIVRPPPRPVLRSSTLVTTTLAHRIIDGRAYAAEILREVRDDVADLRSRGHAVGIATLLVGDDYAASVYQRRIDRHAKAVGAASRPVRITAEATFGQVVGKIAELDVDPDITGILVLRPLPGHIEDARVFAHLPVLKDVEAQHPENAGLLALGTPRFVPSTAAAAFNMLDRYMRASGHDPATAYDGLDLVIVGRSNNVGKPAAILGLQRNATVISAHKHTHDAGRLPEHTRQADLLIVAAGRPGLIGADHVREGAIVVDIGINPVTDPDGKVRLVGDVDTESVLPRVRGVSPVPGGVGPITDAWVLRNTLTAARALASHSR